MEPQEAVYIDDRKISQVLNVLSGRLVRYALSDIMSYIEAPKIGIRDQPKDGE